MPFLTNIQYSMKTWTLTLLLFVTAPHAAQLNCDMAVTPIPSIQGKHDHSDIEGDLVVVKGVVTGDFRGQQALSGFFVQQQQPDNDSQTSEGIFIHHQDTRQNLQIGDLVVVKGRVSEQFDVTQIGKVAAVKVCQRDSQLPPPVLIPMPLEGFDLEHVEGMRVSFEQPVVISDLYQFVKFGEVTVSSDLLYAPTTLYRPGDKVPTHQKNNDQNKLIIDDGSFSEYPSSSYVNAENPLTLGQKLNVVGVMHFAFGKYKIQPTEALKIGSATVQNQPLRPKGSFTVANFNMENLFTTIDNGEKTCGPTKNFYCRGADSKAEYDRQIQKLVKAINVANTSVVALQELENNAQSGMALVSALNQSIGFKKWAVIETGVLGVDAIKVGLIYQPKQVTPIGDFALLNSKANPEFKENKHRIVVMQTFKTKQHNLINVAAAHFKSKSCKDAEGINLDQHDGQGCYNAARVEVAGQISDWLHSDPTGQGAEMTLLAGDLNSYQFEDPIVVLNEKGYVNLARHFLGEKNWTVSYRGQVGSLDYILANKAAMNVATGVTQWHINSIHSAEFDYNLDPLNDSTTKPAGFYSQSPFSSSDHDMVIAGFDL